MSTIQQLRDKTIEELNIELISLLREQFNLRVQKGIGQAPQAHLFRKVRRQVARIKTIIRQKEGN